MLVKKILMLFGVIVFIGGCTAKSMVVTYYSDPPGAILYMGKEKLGFAPHAIKYKISDEEREKGEMWVGNYTPIVARWQSGAETVTSPTSYFDISKISVFTADDYYYVLKRPEGYPGLDNDISTGEFVTEMQRAKAQAARAAAEAAAARDAANAEAAAAKKAKAEAESMYYRSGRY